MTGANLIIESNLWHAYAASFFNFKELPNQHSFIIITAWNPRSAILSIEENRTKNQLLLTDLQGYEWTLGIVGDESFTWCEESYAVALELEQAINLARKFEQNAIYRVSGNRLFLHSCLEDHQQECLGEFQSRIVR